MDEFDTIVPDVPPEFQVSEPDEPEKGWPSFRYGPDGQSAVFQCKADVPSGWHDHPSKVKGAPDPSKEPVLERRRGRSQIAKDLRLLKVEFPPQASAKQLEKLLTDAQNRARTEKAREAKAAKPKAPPKPRKKAAPKAAKPKKG